MADKVRVSNELDLDTLNRAAAQRSSPFDTKIIPLDRDDDPVVLPSSPAGWDVDHEPEWESREAVGAAPDTLDWSHSPPATTTLEVTVQANSQAVGGVTPRDLKERLWQISQFAKQPTRTTGEPTRVVVERGSNRGSTTGYITSFSKNVTETDPQGLPRTAEISIEVTGGR